MSDETISIEFSCVNCDQVFVVSGAAKLYCSQRCHQDAKLVRYVRACIKDGRINDPLVNQAIGTRFAFAYSEKGYYDEKARLLSREKRQQVIERAGGLCEQCGAVGTEIDHMNGDSDDLDDLQLLCHDCHSEKTEASMVPITPEHERYDEIIARENELRARIEAPTPLRPCDDEANWNDFYKGLLTEQRQLLKRIKEDVEGKARNVDPIEEERITQELNELNDLNVQRETLEAERQARIDEILTPELLARVKSIEEEYDGYIEPLDEAISELQERIERRTEQNRFSVKGIGYHAIWRRGAVKWDNDGLEEYSITHLEILQYRKEGKGSAIVVPIKKKQSKSPKTTGQAGK
jgi:5-methylcytosine-specific restriction endonuclease McrA